LSRMYCIQPLFTSCSRVLVAASVSAAALVPFQLYWRNYPRLTTPAWVDVLSSNTATYNMQGGLLAVRDLTMGNLDGLSDLPGASEDYYSSSLRLLVMLARGK